MKPYKVNIFGIIGISIIIVIVGWVVFLGTSSQPVIENKFSEKGVEAILIIDDGKPLKYEFDESITAFDLLKKAGLALEVKNYDIGIFIEAIGNKKNGQDNKYWMYYINGKMPMIAADKYILKPGDKVEFRFETIDRNLF